MPGRNLAKAKLRAYNVLVPCRGGRHDDAVRNLSGCRTAHRMLDARRGVAAVWRKIATLRGERALIGNRVSHPTRELP